MTILNPHIPYAAGIYGGTTYRERWNPTKLRWEKQFLVNATDWFTYEANPSCFLFFKFQGVFFNAARNQLISDAVLRYSDVGGGNLEMIQQLYTHIM